MCLHKGCVTQAAGQGAKFLAAVPPRDDRAISASSLTRANRQPAMAIYRLDPGSKSRVFRALAIVVLIIDGDTIAGITALADPTLMRAFGLPTQLAPDRAYKFQRWSASGNVARGAGPAHGG